MSCSFPYHVQSFSSREQLYHLSLSRDQPSTRPRTHTIKSPAASSSSPTPTTSPSPNPSQRRAPPCHRNTSDQSPLHRLHHLCLTETSPVELRSSSSTHSRRAPSSSPPTTTTSFTTHASLHEPPFGRSSPTNQDPVPSSSAASPRPPASLVVDPTPLVANQPTSAMRPAPPSSASTRSPPQCPRSPVDHLPDNLAEIPPPRERRDRHSSSRELSRPSQTPTMPHVHPHYLHGQPPPRVLQPLDLADPQPTASPRRPPPPSLNSDELHPRRDRRASSTPPTPPRSAQQPPASPTPLPHPLTTPTSCPLVVTTFARHHRSLSALRRWPQPRRDPPLHCHDSDEPCLSPQRHVAVRRPSLSVTA